jgi:hypothetical protein
MPGLRFTGKRNGNAKSGKEIKIRLEPIKNGINEPIINKKEHYRPPMDSKKGARYRS